MTPARCVVCGKYRLFSALAGKNLSMYRCRCGGSLLAVSHAEMGAALNCRPPRAATQAEVKLMVAVDVARRLIR